MQIINSHEKAAAMLVINGQQVKVTKSKPCPIEARFPMKDVEAAISKHQLCDYLSIDGSSSKKSDEKGTEKDAKTDEDAKTPEDPAKDKEDISSGKEDAKDDAKDEKSGTDGETSKKTTPTKTTGTTKKK